MNRRAPCIVLLVIILICVATLIKKESSPTDTPQQKSIDYASYLNKTWVTEDRLGTIGSNYTFSFYITKIDDGLIEGRYIGSLADRRVLPRHQDRKFSGNISGDSAECQFIVTPILVGEDGSEFNVKLYFHEDNRILMLIEPSIDGAESGYYLYRPYDLNDLGFRYRLKRKKLFPIELDYGEDVSVLAAVLTGDGIGDDELNPYIYPYIYLINENEEILYQLNLPFLKNTEVTAATTEDANGDGLKDIILTTCWADGGKQAEWLLYQTESGDFYVSEEANESE